MKSDIRPLDCYSGRPDFIPAEVFREYLSTTYLDKHLRIETSRPSSWIAKWEKNGRPIKHRLVNGQKRWRLLDIVARARAENLSLFDVQKAREDLNWYQQEIEKARKELDDVRKRSSRWREQYQQHQFFQVDVSEALTGKHMLSESAIVNQSRPVPSLCGVYFLIENDRVVYVGQSVNVLNRVQQHKQSGKTFDRFAYLPTDKEKLNVVESLYIHFLQPPLNGMSGDRAFAPIPMGKLIDMMTSTPKKAVVEKVVEREAPMTGLEARRCLVNRAFANVGAM